MREMRSPFGEPFYRYIRLSSGLSNQTPLYLARFDDEFIKNRKEELLLFLDGVVNTPQLMYTVSLRQFLESVELDWD